MIVKSYSIACVSVACLFGQITLIGAEVSFEREEKDRRWEAVGGFGIRQSPRFSFERAATALSGALFDPALSVQQLLDAAGPLDQIVDRSYDNGFVRAGPGTGLTSHWSYSGAGQVGSASQEWDPSGGQSLYFTRVGETGLDGQGGDGRLRSSPKLFPFLELRRIWIPEDGKSERGLTAGWSLLRAKGGVGGPLSFTTPWLIDEYFLYGIFVPEAPYQGPETPPGPLLDNQPHDRVIENVIGDWTGTSRMKFILNIHTFSVGGLWRFFPRTTEGSRPLWIDRIDVKGGFTYNQARFRVSEQTVYSGTNSHGEFVEGGIEKRMSVRRHRCGWYGSISTLFELREETEFLLIEGRYDDAGRIQVAASGNRASVDLSGWSLRAGLVRNW